MSGRTAASASPVSCCEALTRQQRHLDVPPGALAQFRRGFQIDVARAGLVMHKADMRRAIFDRGIDRFGRGETADFDEWGHITDSIFPFASS